MTTTYTIATQEFKTILDFLRFGLSKAHENDLYYGHGTDNAWDDLIALIAGSLHLPPSMDAMFLNACLSQEEREFLCLQLHRRIHDRVPVPYLTHKAYFCDLEFYVDERVLIPRSPIAELIKQGFSPWIDEEQVTNILDLCTGSGCIGIACLSAFPEAQVDLSDLSSDALQVAEMNRKKHHLEQDVQLFKSDCFDDIPPKQYDIIVSNPPYVGQAEMQTLPEEYNHEPTIALETGNNGLAIVEKILRQSVDYLSEHGLLVVEVGNSEEALINAYPDVPFTWLEFEHGGHGVFLLTYDQLKTHFASRS